MHYSPLLCTFNFSESRWGARKPVFLWPWQTRHGGRILTQHLTQTGGRPRAESRLPRRIGGISAGPSRLRPTCLQPRCQWQSGVALSQLENVSLHRFH